MKNQIKNQTNWNYNKNNKLFNQIKSSKNNNKIMMNKFKKL